MRRRQKPLLASPARAASIVALSASSWSGCDCTDQAQHIADLSRRRQGF